MFVCGRMLLDVIEERKQNMTDVERASEAALKAIETTRRGCDYYAMQKAVDTLLARIVHDTSEAAFRIRAKVNYERHMAAWQQGHINDSMNLAVLSKEAAIKGNDAIGVLFAEMNIGGHLLPALGEWQEGLYLLAGVCNSANAILAQEATPEARLRAQRVAMNGYALRIRIAIENTEFWLAVEEWLGELRKNPVFLSYKGEEWADTLVRDAEAFVHEGRTS